MKRTGITIANDALAEAMGLPEGVGIAATLPDPIAPVSHVVVIYDDTKYEIQDAEMPVLGDAHKMFKEIVKDEPTCGGATTPTLPS